MARTQQEQRERSLRTTQRARELRYDAGALILNLVATVGRRISRPIERLDTPGRLVEWFDRIGLPVAPAAVDQTLLSAVRRLRDASYRILSALMTGTEPPQDAIATVNAYAAVPVPAPTLIWSGPAPHVVWGTTAGLSGEAAMALLARDLIDHLRDPHWPALLRACTATDCGMIFLDSSQGGRRRWCSMDTCGNRAKAASHRARRSVT